MFHLNCHAHESWHMQVHWYHMVLINYEHDFWLQNNDRPCPSGTNMVKCNLIANYRNAKFPASIAAWMCTSNFHFLWVFHVGTSMSFSAKSHANDYDCTLHSIPTIPTSCGCSCWIPRWETRWITACMQANKLISVLPTLLVVTLFSSHWWSLYSQTSCSLNNWVGVLEIGPDRLGFLESI